MNLENDLVLYDPRYNLKTPTNISKLHGLGIHRSAISNAKKRRGKIRSLNCYILKHDTTQSEYRELYEKEVFEAETWKEVEGSNGKYIISNHGRFKKMDYKKYPNGRFILPFIIRGKRKKDIKQFVQVIFKGKYHSYSVSRLVAYHFVELYWDADGWDRPGKSLKYLKYNLENDFNKLIVSHKNGITYDNYHNNLEFLDREDFNKKIGRLNVIKKGIKIICIDIHKDEIVGEYTSLRDAAEKLYYGVSTIHGAVKERKIIGGRYKFEVVKDEY